jgi:hypothetical protein
MEEEKTPASNEEKKTARNDKEDYRDEEQEDEDAGFLDDAPKYYQPGIIP